MTAWPRRAIGQAWRLLQRSLGALLALLVLFEEWGWAPLQRGLAWLGRWPPLRWLELAIARLPPAGAMAVFVLPMLALLPVKLGALWLIAQGQVLTGVLLVLAAKVLGTALVARLFTLTRPTLMGLPWFFSACARWLHIRAWLIAQVHATWAWRAGRAASRLWLRRWQRWRRPNQPG